MNRRMEIKDNTGRYEWELVNGDHRRLTPFATGHLPIFLLEVIFYLLFGCVTRRMNVRHNAGKKFLLIFIAPPKVHETLLGYKRGRKIVGESALSLSHTTLSVKFNQIKMNSKVKNFRIRCLSRCLSLSGVSIQIQNVTLFTRLPIARVFIARWSASSRPSSFSPFDPEMPIQILQAVFVAIKCYVFGLMAQKYSILKRGTSLLASE